VATPVILLPGGVLPATPAYADLITALGPSVDARTKELAIYADDTVPPAGWSLDTEVVSIARFADEIGFERFHLVGYSAGGAASVLFCAEHPERLLSLTLNEPAWTGREEQSDAERSRWEIFASLLDLPPADLMPAFIRAELADGVPMPPPPDGPPPPWMPSRMKGIKAFIAEFLGRTLELDPLRKFPRPVLYTLGGKSHPDYYGEIAERLAKVFGDYTVEVFPERHHFDPPHRIEPERMAEILRTHWARAGSA
jgi:pimeloyl-ACP methyl ester carboxylesterase